MHLDLIHEKAIDLFVAGKRQHEVALELNVTPRTIRRWCEDAHFAAALAAQHRISRALELGERAQVARDRREIHRKTMEQIQALLHDPEAPLPLRALCLKLGMQDAQFEQRQCDAQEWRESVQAARAAEKRASHAAQQELMRASGALDRSENLFDALKLSREQAIANVFAKYPLDETQEECGDEHDDDATPQKVPATPTAVAAPAPTLKGAPTTTRTAPAPILQSPPPRVQPVSPIRNAPQKGTKADKTGHAPSPAPEADAEAQSRRNAGTALIDRACREALPERMGRDKSALRFTLSQQVAHELASPKSQRPTFIGQTNASSRVARPKA